METAVISKKECYMFKKLQKKLESVTRVSRKSKEMSQYVVIGHPKENEIINHPSYTIKIGVSGEGNAEVSIDGGDWKSCRQAENFWWYDWANYPSGTHKIIARLRDNKGEVIKKSEIRRCTS